MSLVVPTLQQDSSVLLQRGSVFTSVAALTQLQNCLLILSSLASTCGTALSLACTHAVLQALLTHTPCYRLSSHTHHATGSPHTHARLSSHTPCYRLSSHTHRAAGSPHTHAVLQALLTHTPCYRLSSHTHHATGSPQAYCLFWESADRPPKTIVLSKWNKLTH